MDLLVQDDALNISEAHLRPAYAFGGSCSPKDIRAITFPGRKQDLNIPLLSSVLTRNEAHLRRGFAMIRATAKRRIAMIGLSFKPGTDDLRESPFWWRYASSLLVTAIAYRFSTKTLT